MPVTVELRDRLARGLCSLVGTGRHQQRSLPLLCVGMGVEEAAEQSPRDFSKEILILFSIIFSTATYNLEYNKII